MEHQISERHEILRWVAYMTDALYLAIYYWIAGRNLYQGTHEMQELLTLAMSYLLSVSIFVPVAQNRMVQVEEVIRRAIITAVAMAAVIAICESVLLQVPFNFRAFFAIICIILFEIHLKSVKCTISDNVKNNNQTDYERLSLYLHNYGAFDPNCRLCCNPNYGFVLNG